ncbi:phosphatase inhibitor-domain-containing protein [Scheffersomyces amazonensis]|uniref:phosphatase inhibitor-domain-containing protein n=1 Tax=Scheffersomyces amazonensis TaxID=1078765 RepID=UPI00315C8B26
MSARGPEPRHTGGETVTQTETHPILRLRNADKQNQKKQSSQTKPAVRWNEDVVDNEHMNKKKSKICCIFHPQREFGEDSGDSSSDSSSDESGDEGRRDNFNHNHNHNHNHGDHDHDHDHENVHDGDEDHICEHGHVHSKKSRKSAKDSKPNAYETQPHYPNQSTLPQELQGSSNT